MSCTKVFTGSLADKGVAAVYDLLALILNTVQAAPLQRGLQCVRKPATANCGKLIAGTHHWQLLSQDMLACALASLYLSAAALESQTRQLSLTLLHELPGSIIAPEPL